MSQHLSCLTDSQIRTALLNLRDTEHNATIEILCHLNELERRKLHIEEGYSSLFAYSVEKLHYSESGANRRIRSARCIRDFPEVLDRLKTGEVTITTVSIFAGILTKENVSEVLSSVMRKTQREVEAFVAGFQPPKRVPEIIKPVRVEPRPQKVPAPMPLFESSEPREAPPLEQKLEAHRHSGGNLQPEAALVSYKVQFVLSAESLEKYEEAKNLLSHKFPKGAGFEDVFTVLVDTFLDLRSPERRARRRALRQARKGISPATSSPADLGRTTPAEPDQKTRTIPVSIRDAVTERDGGQCAYVGPDGHRCQSRYQLELHHEEAFALGGSHSVTNLRNFCRVHNQYAADLVFGREVMDQYRGVEKLFIESQPPATGG